MSSSAEVAHLRVTVPSFVGDSVGGLTETKAERKRPLDRWIAEGKLAKVKATD